MHADNGALVVAIALAAGMVAQAIARHLRLPGILVLLGFGVLLGPDVVGVVQPQVLGDGLVEIVKFAVAIILFEGALALDIGELRRQALPIRRLVTVGVVLTGIGAAVASHFIMGWEWRLAVPFGALVTVTGPTVVNPLLRRIRVTRRVQTILEGEGILIDPIGAILAVVVLEVILTSTAAAAAEEILGLPMRLGVGLACGATGGLLLALLLRANEVIPQEYANVFTAAWVLALFALSEWLAAESGIVAAVVSGLVVGNMHAGPARELREFKEQLSVLFIGLLFILLAADVRIEQVTRLGWPAIATVAVLMFVVRPLDVAVSTAGSNLTVRERLFISWLAPRGIVAAAVASLFAQQLSEAGIAGGIELRALVFMVIAVTVVVPGVSAGSVATLLGLRRASEQGYAIAGANALGRALARALQGEGEEVVLIDLNEIECRRARKAGLEVICGNALEPDILERADVGGRRGLLAVTPSESVNLLLARRARRLTRLPHSYVALDAATGVEEDYVAELGSRVLFGRPIELESWVHRLRHGEALVEARHYTGSSTQPGSEPAPVAAGVREALPLILKRKRRIVPVDEATRCTPGDIVIFAASDDARPDLEAAGWLPLPDTQP